MEIYASDAGSYLYFSQNLQFSGLSLFYQHKSFAFSSGLCSVSKKVQVLDQ